MNNYPNPSPPLISLTPSSAPRTRSRAGTLPSSLFSGRSSSTSPMVPTTTDALGLPTMESLSLPQPALEPAPQQTAPQGRRMRSGSLFSTNSIWNDDALATSPQSSMYDQHLGPDSNSASQSQFLNIPTTEATPQGRNRSYTTTAAPNSLAGLPNQSYSMFDSFGLNRVSPFTQTPHTVANTDVNSLLDSLMLNIQPQDTTYSPTPRIRSQTFSGSAPSLPDSLIGQAPPPPPVFSVYQQNAQQQPAQPQAQQQPSSQQQSYYAHQPVLQDDFDITSVALTTNFDNPNLGPTKNILLDNLPHFIDSGKLYQVLASSLGNQRSFGVIQAVRICPVNNSKLALVECSNVDTAMSLKASFNHIEFVPGVVLYVAFAKVGSQSMATPAPPAAAAPTAGESSSPPKQNGQHNHKTSEKPAPIEVSAIQPHLAHIIDILAGNNQLDRNKVASLIKNAIDYDNNQYQNNFGPLPDPIPLRQFDSPKLRELRKILENNEAAISGNSCPSSPNQSGSPSPSDRIMSQLELEELCLAMLDELPELCYDYLGNTIVQKLFLLVESPVIKLMMVKEIAPYLTQLAIHKNGTWAIQKIINLAIGHTQQMTMIAQSLKPYAVKLFNDQFGNYVLQGCVKFGSPYNDFIFETLLDNFLEISFGRFGARCIRTILENAEGGHIPYEQVMLVASLIVEFANDLVVNSNGSLLITWFLDTFNSEPIVEGRARSGSLGTRQRSSSTASETIKDDRYALLTQKFLPNLARLCTHKLANLTILKIVNNRSDLVSKQVIMDAIFGSFEECERQMSAAQGMDEYSYPQPSRLLEQILQENPEHNAAGPLFIYKILSNPLALTLPDSHGTVDSKSNSRYFEFIVSQVKRILLESNITNLQPYKKLMDEVGLPTNRISRSASLGGGQGRRNKRSANGGRAQGSSPSGKQYHNNYYQGPTQNHNHGQGPSQGQTNPNFQIPQVYGGPAMPMHMLRPGQQPASMAYPSAGLQEPESAQQQLQQDMAVMKQLEQLSLSSAAMGYNSSPGTPSTNRNQFL